MEIITAQLVWDLVWSLVELFFIGLGITLGILLGYAHGCDSTLKGVREEIMKLEIIQCTPEVIIADLKRYARKIEKD